MLEPGLEGLIHVTQLSNEHVDHPSDVVSTGDIVTLRILRINLERKRIGLSLKDAPQWIEVDAAELLRPDHGLEPEPQPEEEATEPVNAQPEMALLIPAEVSAVPA